MSTGRGLAWFIVDKQSDGSQILMTFTAANWRRDAWRTLEELYDYHLRRDEELARIRRDRRSGKLRAVKATVTWEAR